MKYRGPRPSQGVKRIGIRTPTLAGEDHLRPGALVRPAEPDAPVDAEPEVENTSLFAGDRLWQVAQPVGVDGTAAGAKEGRGWVVDFGRRHNSLKEVGADAVLELGGRPARLVSGPLVETALLR